jgi:hypothetical protein
MLVIINHRRMRLVVETVRRSLTNTLLHITIPEVQDEVPYALTTQYSPAATERPLDSITSVK